MKLRFLLGLLLILPARAGRFDLPEGNWSNRQRPAFQVRVGGEKSHSMVWWVDSLELKGTYRVTAVVGPPHVLFHVDSMTADGQPARQGRVGAILVKPGDNVRSVWDWTDNGLKLTVQGEGEQRLTVPLLKSVPNR